MADEKFPISLLRMVAAELHLQNSPVISREMFDRGYFSLGVGEKIAVDQAALSAVAGNYQAITPEFLEGQQGLQPMGFPIQAPTPIQENSKNGKSG